MVVFGPGHSLLIFLCYLKEQAEPQARHIDDQKGMFLPNGASGASLYTYVHKLHRQVQWSDF